MISIITRRIGILAIALLALASCRNEDNLIEPTCFDEVRNQGEVRIDCGGPNCPFCEPSCDDREENQDEISPVTLTNPNVRGIDCGGANCEPCATCEDGILNGHWVRDLNITAAEFNANTDSIAIGANGIYYRLIMESGIDCGFPCPVVCLPTCEDGIRNGNEDGIDCGSGCEFPCAPPSCNDGIQNGTETGVDCGDAIEPSFCGECPPPTCNDGIQNIHIELTEMVPLGYLVVFETGIDCDNNPLTACPDCPFPTCWDGVQNGSETGIDCGGNCFTLCDTAATCTNGILDGDEAGVDCDFDAATACPPCATCADEILNGAEFEIDCVDYFIDAFPSCEVCPSCHDDLETVEQFELDIDCSGIGDGCEPCLQEVTAAGIGTAGSPFRDQYSYNILLAAAGQDTLSLNHSAYPGLKVEKVLNPFGINYLKVTANQGFDTGGNGLFIRTVEIFMPVPGATNLSLPIAMINLGPPTPGICGPFPVDALPYVIYKEILVDNPNLVNRCFTSYVPVGQTSTLTFDYWRGYAEISKSYTKGDVNQGSLRSTNFTGTTTEGSFTNLDWKLLYSFF